MQLRAGDPRAIGEYTLRARLGAGGMGTVYLAHTSSGQPVALKLIHQQFLDDDEFRIRFRQEVAAAGRVSGAYTAAVVDADPDGDHPWMATTYIPGPTLAQRIAEHGALSGAELRTLAIGLVEALRDIHRAGVVHRDLKPSNVVLSPDGPRVIDFGISRAADHQTLTMTGRVIGTPPFMSPEQLQAPRDVGTESDVFSVATLLVYAATGQGPFDADSPYMTAYQVVHEAPVLGRVPAPLRAVVEPCLAKDRTGRPSADELLRRLRALPEDLAPPRRTPVATRAGGAPADADGVRTKGHARAADDPRALNGARAADDSRLVSGDTHGRDGVHPADNVRSRERVQAAGDVLAGDADTHVSASAAWAERDASAWDHEHHPTDTWDDGSGTNTWDEAPGTDAESGPADAGDSGTDRPTVATRSAVPRPASATAATATAADAEEPGLAASAPGAVAAGRRPRRPPFSARGLRRRWRTVVAVAAAVAAISTGVTLLSSGGGERGRDGSEGAGTDRGSVTVAQTPPPEGFRPWQKTVPGGQGITDELRCEPHGDSVYCGGGGVLAVRLRSADGTQVWKRPNPGLPMQGVHLLGVADGTVLGFRTRANSTEALEIVGLSASDGRELWSSRPALNSGVFTGRPQPAVLLGDTVFSVDAARTRIEARAARTGGLSWTTTFPAGSECLPVVAGERLYAMCAPDAEVGSVDITHPAFHTVDLTTGALGDALRVEGQVRPVGAAKDGSLVVLKQRRDDGGYNGYARLARLDPRTGHVTSSPVKPHAGATPWMAGGTLYLAGDSGLISAVDVASGKEKWAVQTSVEAASGPVLSHGVLYFSSASGRVVALRERDGAMRWSTNPRSESVGQQVPVSPRVALDGGALIVTSSDNTVFGFDAAKPPKSP